jgi:serine/threonine protein phosphatase PrpC
MLINCYGLTDPGCVRTVNEDSCVTRPEMGYFAVVDGMGGHRNGEIAAELTLSTIQYYLESSQGRPDVTWPFGYNMVISLNANRLATAIRLANRQVWKRADERPDFAGMGSTVAAVLLSADEASVANIGDSRVYLFRAGRLTQLTSDDTWLNAVIAKDMLDTASLERHPMRNVLTQAVGSQSDVEVHTTDLCLEPADFLLLSTDGLHAVVGDNAICAAFARGGTPEALAKRLVENARSAGGPDNISCVVVGLEAEATSGHIASITA